MRRKAVSPHLKPDESIAVARAHPGQPIVLADRWDNPGGGVPGDGTLMIETLLQHPDLPGRGRRAVGPDRRRVLPGGGRRRAAVAAHRRQGDPDLGPSGGRPCRRRGALVRSRHPLRAEPGVARGGGLRLDRRRSTSCSAPTRAQTFSPDGLHGDGHRPFGQEDRRGEVLEPLLRRLLEDRGRDPPSRLRRPVPAGPGQDRLHPRPPAARADGPGPVGADARSRCRRADGAALARLAARRDGQGRAGRRGQRAARTRSGAKGWNLLAGDLPLPAAVLRHDRLLANSAWMSGLLPRRTAFSIAPHGKTTMAPQLFALQLAAGAWAITVATVQQLAVCRRFGIPRVRPREPAGRPRRDRRLLRRARGRGRRRAALPRRFGRGRGGARGRASRDCAPDRVPWGPGRDRRRRRAHRRPHPRRSRWRSRAPSPPRPASRSPGSSASRACCRTPRPWTASSTRCWRWPRPARPKGCSRRSAPIVLSAGGSAFYDRVGERFGPRRLRRPRGPEGAPQRLLPDPRYARLRRRLRAHPARDAPRPCRPAAWRRRWRSGPMSSPGPSPAAPS